MNNQSTRVNLARMKRAYESTRDIARNVPVLTQRAVAHIDKDMHMVGRVGRFRLESDEPPGCVVGQSDTVGSHSSSD